MTSKTYFRIASIFLVIFILTYFVELFNLPVWIHRVACLVFATFAFLGYYQKKKEDKADTSTK